MVTHTSSRVRPTPEVSRVSPVAERTASVRALPADRAMNSTRPLRPAAITRYAYCLRGARGTLSSIADRAG